MNQASPPSCELPSAPPTVSYREALRTWCRVAALSFGGPAGQIAVMHRILVDEKKWISEPRFLHALNYCMLLPGPEAQQLATYIGWLLHRTLGGVTAGTLFVLPGFVAIMLLSVLYVEFQQATLVAGLFFGLKPAVMAIVLEAVLRIGKRVLKNGAMVAIAVASFVAIFFFGVPFPLLILIAAAIGLVGGRLAPERFHVIKGHGADQADAVAYPAEVATAGRSLWGRSAVICAIFLVLWFGPLAAIAATVGTDSVFFQQGVFFSKAAVVTFGGAYSVLAYIGQQAVDNFGWLEPGEMLDGLGMAETTPGPLIMVVQFVGFLGAYRNPGPFEPMAAAILGSVITVWVTFVPCFFWIFLGAPYVERLRGNHLLSSALSAITAAVVGVVLNLAVWFSIHTLFAQVETLRWHALRIEAPVLASWDWRAAAIAVVACLMTFKWKRGMAATLAACALLGIALFTATQ